MSIKASYDANHRELSFEVGRFGWLKLYPYRQRTLVEKAGCKLSSKFCGPFKILQRVGQVAYALELAPDSRIHDVFHISQLKVFCGEPPVSLSLCQVYRQWWMGKYFLNRRPSCDQDLIEAFWSS